MGAILIVLAGFALRAYNLDHWPLWIDEGYTAYQQRQSVPQILLDLVPDHVPVHYLLLHFWTKLAGENEFSLRYVSVLFGTASLPLVYVITRRLFREDVSVVALLLCSVSPFLIYWSQQARVSALALFLSLAVLCLGQRCVSHIEGNSRNRFAADAHSPPASCWQAWTTATLIGLYSFYYVALVILATDIYFLCRVFMLRSFNALRPWLVSRIVALLLFVPWILLKGNELFAYVSPGQAGTVALDWAKPYAPKGDYTVPAGISRILSITWRSIATGEIAVAEITEQDSRSALIAIASILAILGAVAVVRMGRRGIYRQGLLLALWLAVPTAAIYLIDERASNFYPRHLLSIAPAFYILIAACLLLPRRRHTVRATVLMLFCTSTLVAGVIGDVYYVVDSYSNPSYLRQDYRSLALYLTENLHPKDAVVLDAKWQYATFSYYFREPLTILGLPGEHPPDVEATNEALKDTVTELSTVWLVNHAQTMSDPTEIVEKWLTGNAYRLPYDRWFGQIRLSGFIPRVQDGFDPTTIPNRTAVTVDGRVDLLGYEISNRRAKPGETVAVSLYWRARAVMLNDYQVFVHLVDRTQDRLICQSDGPPLRGAKPTSTWQTGETLRDEYLLRIPPLAEPGIYELVAGMYWPDNVERLALVQNGDSSVDRTISLGWLKIPLPTESGEMVAGMKPREWSFGNQIRLLGSEVQEVNTRLHSSLQVELIWQGLASNLENYTVFVQLIDENRQLRSQTDEQPLSGRYPTMIWETGEVVHDYHTIDLPSQLEAGTYELILGLYEPGSLRRLPLDDAFRQTFVRVAQIEIPSGRLTQ